MNQAYTFILAKDLDKGLYIESIYEPYYEAIKNNPVVYKSVSPKQALNKLKERVWIWMYRRAYEGIKNPWAPDKALDESSKHKLIAKWKSLDKQNNNSITRKRDIFFSKFVLFALPCQSDISFVEFYNPDENESDLSKYKTETSKLFSDWVDCLNAKKPFLNPKRVGYHNSVFRLAEIYSSKIQGENPLSLQFGDLKNSDLVILASKNAEQMKGLFVESVKDTTHIVQ